MNTAIHNIPEFGVNQATFDRNTKEMYGHTDGALLDSVRMAIHFFVNFNIFKWLYLAYYRVYLHQTWGFCKAWSALYDYVDH